MLSIVIPALNTAGRIGATLAALREDRPAPAREIVVVDGGSVDLTVPIARAAGARVIEAPANRGGQCAAGAAAARGDWLLFLHADTRLAGGWGAAVARFVAEAVNRDRAAYFAFALDDPAPGARRLERLVAWRCRALALPYGDQGLLVRRGHYLDIGGHRPLPLMEDVDLVRRLGRGRLVGLEVMAVTSADRWRRDGWWRRSARNLGCLGLYLCGVPPRWIARLYG